MQVPPPGKRAADGVLDLESVTIETSPKAGDEPQPGCGQSIRNHLARDSSLYIGVLMLLVRNGGSNTIIL